MVDKNEISRFLKKHFEITGEVTIDDEGLVSCTGDVTLKQQKKWKRLPVAFDKVGLTFGCYNNQLTTLEGAPTSVGGRFVCNNNQLTTLEGAPTSVSGSFVCSNNQLTTLQGAPTSVGGIFWCDHNQLTTLQGAPTSVGVSFLCNNNQLTTLEGLPVVTKLDLSYSPTLPLLRCLLAKKVEFNPELRNKTIENILNQYAGRGEAGAFECGAELATAGFKENARW